MTFTGWPIVALLSACAFLALTVPQFLMLTNSPTTVAIQEPPPDLLELVERSAAEDLEGARNPLLVVMLVDALRPDMLYSSEYFPYFNSILIGQESNLQARTYVAEAAAPTVTLPKLKSILSGTNSNFLDLILNFAATEMVDDNVVHKMVSKAIGRTIAFCGDDTWTTLFPTAFAEHDEVFSFDVSDYTEIDNRVTECLREHLAELHDSHESVEYKDKATKPVDTIVAHFLGLDHIGHTLGPDNDIMHKKQHQMDSMIREIVEAAFFISSAASSADAKRSSARAVAATAERDITFLLLSDHGMAKVGGHGGTTAEEIRTCFAVISTKDWGTAALSIADEETAFQPMIELDVLSRDATATAGSSSARQLVEFPWMHQVDISAVWGLATISRTHWFEHRRWEMEAATISSRLSQAIRFAIPQGSIGIVPWGLLSFALNTPDSDTSHRYLSLLLTEHEDRLERIGKSKEIHIPPLEDFSEVQRYNRLRRLQSQLLLQEMRTSSADVILRPVVLGTILLGVFALLRGMYQLCSDERRLSTPFLCTATVGVLHSALLFSSSFAEEEHLLARYLCCTTVIVYGLGMAVKALSSSEYRKDVRLRRGAYSALCLAALALVLLRLTDNAHHSGNKWKYRSPEPFVWARDRKSVV